jgi:3-hydroxyisobutyrate dehydrogenase-like beta-hydroxyacid dehydrogenase
MGAEVGRDLVGVGHAVGWLPGGRGPGTRRRASEASLYELDGFGDCDIVISVCPPAAAVDTARSVQGFSGLYVDANAVSPETAREVESVVRHSGASYVDGGIIGPPPTRPGTTRLYLSGERADEVARCFAATRLEAVVLDDAGTVASALKMTYAAWTKISAALMVSLRATAASLGVGDALAGEWARSQPGLEARHAAALNSAREKGWRWSDEMLEIARTFSSVGEPAGFGEAASDVFVRWPRPVDD